MTGVFILILAMSHGSHSNTQVAVPINYTSYEACQTAGEATTSQSNRVNGYWCIPAWKQER